MNSTADNLRFNAPLYTVAEAARYVAVPASTLGTWAWGYDRTVDGREVRGDPVITAVRGGRGRPSIPFVGLAEATVLAAFRRARGERKPIPLQQVRRAVAALEERVGLGHALASRNLYTDGAHLLYDFARIDGGKDAEELAGLTRVIDGQRVFVEVVRDYLERIQYGDDGFAVSLSPPLAPRGVLVINPNLSSGRPILAKSGAPLFALLGRWRAGESLAAIAKDFDADPEDVESAIRAAVAA